jgi:hypothetical protein
MEYDSEGVGVRWRGSTLAPGWRCRRSVAAFGACEAKKDGAALWAESKLSRPVLGVAGEPLRSRVVGLPPAAVAGEPLRSRVVGLPAFLLGGRRRRRRPS